MGFLSLLLLLPGDEPAEALAKKMLPVYVKEASEYTLAVASAPGRALELKKEPVFEWSNPVRSGVQQGVVFLWLRDGRPAAIGSIFSHPEDRFPGRRLCHEFHALDPETLVVSRPDALNEWKPQAGLARQELPDAGTPAATPAARLLQMKKLAAEFTGHEVDTDDAGKTWDLRLLPAPLYRYPAAKSGVVDGAIFALVSNAGTDPEVLLLIEAKEQGGKLRWEYACGRFSDRSLYVQRKGRDFWSCVRDGTDNTFLHGAKHVYRFYPDKVVDADGRTTVRIRATERNWQFIPIADR
ncbi:MAG TPA: hypothetical protein VGF55_08425 [Gemmataceae bacterium]|jgi:hypothetical protein